MSAYTDTLSTIRWPDGPPKKAYDVVIVGGGGHGLSTAYYLATRHGITNVAVLEADYIASGNTGRNTTIIRANYGIPEAIRFYQHSLELYQGLEEETGAEILHQTKGIFWVAHTEMAMRTERARAQMNTACGAKTVMVTPAELKELVPQVDLTGGGRYPVLGASHHVEGATARHDRVAWAFAVGCLAARRRDPRAHAGHRPPARRRRRPGHGRRDRRTDPSRRASSCRRSAAA